jgi:hypothetical protein
MGIGPVSPDKGPAPPEDRLGCDEERRPPFARHQSCQSSNECSVRPRQAGPGDLTAKDSQLLTENEDLGVLVDGVHPVDPGELDQATEQTVQERERHGAGSSPDRSCLVKPGITFLDPTGEGDSRKFDLCDAPEISAPTSSSRTISAITSVIACHTEEHFCQCGGLVASSKAREHTFSALKTHLSGYFWVAQQP